MFSVIFLLSFTVTAFAIHEETPPDEAVVAKGPAKITLGGKIIVRGWFFDNVDSTASPVKTNSQAIYTTNAYLTVDAKVSDNVRGYMELETSNRENNNSGVLYWGSYDTKNDMELKFRQLWLQYTGSGLLGIPGGIKAGHMPIALGEKIFLNNERFGDDAILVWIDPTKEMHLLAGTAKIVDSNNTNAPISLINANIGFINHAADLDAYVLLATYMWDKDNTVGANWTWAHSDGNVPSLSTVIPNVDKLNFHNIGIHANGKIAGLAYAVEGDYQFGKVNGLVDAPLSDTGLVDGQDAKFQAWAVMAKAGYMLDPVNLRAMFAMGSGDNGTGNDKIKEFQAMQGTDATGAIARFPHYTLIYERLVRTASVEALLTTQLGGNIRTTGIANTTVYNLGVDVNPTPELSASLDGYILRATETGAWRDLIGGSVSKSVGSEVDAKLNYKIAKNLSYFVEAGVFFPGNFYRDTDPDVSKKTTTMAVHGLVLTF